MTALERQLTAALERLSAQYEREQRRQSEQVETLPEAGRAAERAGDALDRILRDVRRSVARPLEVTRRRGPERGHGPSR